MMRSVKAMNAEGNHLYQKNGGLRGRDVATERAGGKVTDMKGS